MNTTPKSEPLTEEEIKKAVNILVIAIPTCDCHPQTYIHKDVAKVLLACVEETLSPPR